MDESQHDQPKEDWLTQNLPKALFLLGAIAVILLIAAISTYVHFFGHHSVVAKGDEWGQFGDFFGGVLNPTFSFLAFVGLLFTLYVQSRELRLAREVAILSRRELELSRQELKNSAEAMAAQNVLIDRQRFEQTFFAWVEGYKSCVARVTYTKYQSNTHTTGTDALFDAYDEKLSGHCVLKHMERDGALPEGVQGQWVQQIRTLPPDKQVSFRVAFHHQWNQVVVGGFINAIDPLRGTVRAIIEWVDKQPFSEPEKLHYVHVLESQFSWIELRYLLFFSLTPDWAEFVPLVRKYQILRRLNSSPDPAVWVLSPDLVPKEINSLIMSST